MHHRDAPSSSTDTYRRLLGLEHAVATLVMDTEEPTALVDGLLAMIGTELDWAFAAAWQIRPDGVLGCLATWHDGARAGFAAASVNRELAPGIGLPGRVALSGAPAWIVDVPTDPNFPRAREAAESGLAAAFCFALTSRDGLEGVVECFTNEPLAPSAELLTTAASLGRRVGDALRRHRVDEGVRRSEARLRAVIASALDCIIIADATGRVLEFNPAAVATFGYSRDEALGAELVDLVVPPELRAAHRAGLARYVRTDEGRILDQRIETTAMRRDGGTFPVELTITRIGLPGPPVFAAYLRDLTAARQAEAEVRASHLRVAEAAVAERQRLERDLHDGAQQRLISLGLVLARTRAVPDTPPRVASLLDDAIVQLDEAAVELRNLARGIHPSSLTKYGLAVALADVVRRAPLNVAVGELPRDRFPASIEATAYFVVSEALTNVARHAPAAAVTLDVTVEDGVLVAVVSDDGPGGVVLTAGTGLRGLADRVALLDGALDVTSAPGAGTTVRARLPLPAA